MGYVILQETHTVHLSLHHNLNSAQIYLCPSATQTSKGPVQSPFCSGSLSTDFWPQRKEAVKKNVVNKKKFTTPQKATLFW